MDNSTSNLRIVKFFEKAVQIRAAKQAVEVPLKGIVYNRKSMVCDFSILNPVSQNFQLADRAVSGYSKSFA